MVPGLLAYPHVSPLRFLALAVPATAPCCLSACFVPDVALVFFCLVVLFLCALVDPIQVLFETDKLTDALILEQGFVSLARLQKTEAARG